MPGDELPSELKNKMKNFTDFINFRNDFRFDYIHMLERDYKELLNEEKQEIKCEHCSETVIGKAYGPHVKKYHPETVRNKKSKNSLL